MVTLSRVNSGHPDFITLVKLLDAELAIKDGEEHSFYAQFNKIDQIRYVILARDEHQPVGCGAIKEFTGDAMEVKRMFVRTEYRGRGIASQILTGLESWALEMSYKRCVLETGRRQPEAIALYLKNGYTQIQNYGQYEGKNNSVCFQKKLAR